MKVVKKGRAVCTIELFDENGQSYRKLHCVLNNDGGVALTTYGASLLTIVKNVYRRVVGDEIYMRKEVSDETYKVWFSAQKKQGKVPREGEVVTEERNY